MTIPRWAVAILTIAVSAVSALVSGATVSYQAGARLSEMSTELRHVRESLTPALLTVGNHESRLGIVETRLGYCCPIGSPRASLDWLELGPVGSEPTGVRAGAQRHNEHEAVAGTLPGAVALRGAW